ncbi:MAG: RNA methyltransferase [Nitrososphaerales archaeon]|nr:RNA methyltransferase [Nitrososphaerales archaeon]
MKFNLIATTHRGLEHKASSELFALLTQMSDEAPDVMRTGILGLLVVKTNLQPIKVIEDLRKIVVEDPLRIRYLLRLIPVDTVVDTDIGKIVDAVSSLASRIEENDTFRITIEKRRTSLSSLEVIHAVANVINRSVNLESPDWIVLIEIIGKYTGVSVIKLDQMLNVIKVVRG